MVKRRWSVVLERTVRELQGTDCIGLEHEPPAKQEIACTRSFGQAVLDLSVLQEAVTEFASRAAQKLRLQNGHAAQILHRRQQTVDHSQSMQLVPAQVLKLAKLFTCDVAQIVVCFVKKDVLCL